MKKLLILAMGMFPLFSSSAKADGGTPPARELSFWFDVPNTLRGMAVWYDGRPDMWDGEKKPEFAGNAATNPDMDWEARSLPIGNGSIGANILGSVEAERITFNEKTLWRGGPNTSKGAAYYWDVNKQSAHVLDEIRQAFTDGDQKKAALLTRKNFNSTVPYEA
ncbi:MAG: glycoside hydrolase family 95 protein [Bacteroides sp.]|nr:glycoside hydrolase family 95 protein [Bacteroides sp.]